MAANSKQRRRGSIVQKSKDRWLVRITHGISPTTGKQLRFNKVVRGKKCDAEKYLTNTLSQTDGGIVPTLSKQSLGDWLAEYWETWSGGIAARTRHRSQEFIRLYVPETLLATKINALRPRAFQDLINNLEAKGLSYSTVSFVHRLLRARLNDAVRQGRLLRNPILQGVKVSQKPHVERTTFTPAQARSFLLACRVDRYGALWSTLLLTGLRPGEALGLRWGDFEGDSLRVMRSLVRHPKGDWELKSTKTGRPRTVSLPNAIVTLIREHRLRQLEERLRAGQQYEDHELVFATQLGRPLNMNTEVPRRFKKILRENRLPNLRLYDLRHTAATLLLSDGEHPKIVQERLGHSSISLTMDTYSHVQPDMQRQTAERLDRLFSIDPHLVTA